MSWGHRKPQKQISSRSSQSPTKPDLITVDGAPSHRQPYGTNELVHGPEGLLYAPGGPYTQPSDPGNTLSAGRNKSHQPFDALADDQTTMFVGDKRPSKKAKQWEKWEEETIPLLLRPYIHLLHETKSLHNLSDV